MPADPLPTKIGLVLFPGFQFMDVAGPIDALNILSNTQPISLTILAASLPPVTTKNFVQEEAGSSHAVSLVPTHTFADAPQDLEVLIVPGGLGSRKEENFKPVVEFLKGYKGKVKWILTVCTGSELLAKAGLLKGRRATTNKRAFNQIKADHPDVNWVAKARWVVDGNIWTSSGISAGIDLAFAWIAEVYGQEIADHIADRSEYERNQDPNNDRFAERWGAV